MTDPQVWFVTGASSGFGRAITEAAVAAGDTVWPPCAGPRRWTTSSPRTPASSTPSRSTSPTGGRRRRSGRRDRRHGRIDVLVNNAGRTQVGAIEETTDDELRALFDLHVFGPFALTRAVLPHMRERGSGAIVMISSVGGQVVMPGFGVYCATKFALEAVAETLAAEVAPFGIRVMAVEPGAFRTNLFGPGAAVMSEENPVYGETPGRPGASSRAATAPNPATRRRPPPRSARRSPPTSTPVRLPLGRRRRRRDRRPPRLRPRRGDGVGEGLPRHRLRRRDLS